MVASPIFIFFFHPKDIRLKWKSYYWACNSSSSSFSRVAEQLLSRHWEEKVSPRIKEQLRKPLAKYDLEQK